jgi:polysaccharide biosynthesis protein PslG
MRRLPRLPPRAVAALVTAAAVGALAPAPAEATAPPLRGAATHPLWDSSSTAIFDRELDLLAEAGANHVRIDVGWSTLEEAGDGTLASRYVDRADTFFAHARARGLGVIVTFWTTPCWASSAPADVKQGCSGPWWDRGVHLYPPSNPAEFGEAAAWVAQRWGHAITAIEIWNEPNYQHFFRTSAPARDYASLVRSAYPMIKAVAPGVTVIGPAMLTSDVWFLNAFYDEGGGPYVDGLSLRPFNQGRDPYDASVPSSGVNNSFLLGVPQVRDAMVARGDGAKRLWFTELGWSSCAPGGTHIWCVTPEQQARYVADAFRIIRDRWDYVESVSVYNLRNKGVNPDDRETQMGLLHEDFTPKPSWWTFRSVLAEMAADPGGVQAPATQSVPAPSPSRRPTGAPGADTVPPGLRRLALAPRSFRPGRGRAGGAVLSLSLSEPARLILRVERASRGSHARWIRLRGRIERSGHAGTNRLRFRGRLAGRRLPPGRYRLLVVGLDAAGNRSRAATASFRIER